MRMRPCDFWRITLAEWRALVDGHLDRLESERGERAWVVSHLMNATGNYEHGVITPDSLMGKKEKSKKVKDKLQQPQMPIDELWRLVEGQGNGGS